MDAEQLRRDDADARMAALDVRRSFIVQAPAGSGKTELLTQRFLALLATVEAPESVLAITFTRKAAAEMRNRILDALRHCAAPAGAGGGRDLLPRTRELAAQALARDAQRGWHLLDNPSRLRLLTIDALNQSLARRLPVLSGIGAGLGVEEDARKLYELAAERLLLHLPTGTPRDREAVATLLAHVDNDVRKFIRLAAEMLARREAWLPELPADVEADGQEAAARLELEDARGVIVQRHLELLRAEFPDDLLAQCCACAREAAAVLRAEGRESAIRAWDDVRNLPGSEPGDVPLWRGLAAFLLTTEGNPRKSFSITQGVRAASKDATLAQLKQRVCATAAALEPRQTLCDLLAATAQLPAASYDDDEWRVLKALFVVLRLGAGELKAVFAERNAADYPEFAAAARQALGTADEPTDTALALDARLRHVLVDEFQDTSEAQIRLLEALTAGWEPGDGRTLFVVGDPMQSVYRFRNAEVGLFLDVRERGLGPLALEPLTLRVNFRSTQPVVDWVNHCFERVLPPRDDMLRGAVSFAASVASPDAGAAGGVHVHAFLRRSRALEAQRVADIAAQRLAEPADGRIAILVQGRAHLIDIVAELARRGISFNATNIDPLGARPVVLDLLALTRAIGHLADRAAWLGTLRAPWCGLTLCDLQTLLGDERHAAVVGLLADPTRQAALEPAARQRLQRTLGVLELALDELRRFGMRDTVERAWHALGGPAALTDARELDEARAYFAALADIEAETPGAPPDLARLSAGLQELYAPSRPRPDTRVELLTIHKAKGLQFDTVIVPGLERRGGADAPRLLHWLKIPGQARRNLVVAPLAGFGADRNPLYAWLDRLERAKLEHERRRLLYVAATRAERCLHLMGTCAVVDDKDGNPMVKAPPASVALRLLWPEPAVSGAFAARLAEPGAIDGEPAVVMSRDPVLRRLPADWVLPALPPAPMIETHTSIRSVTATTVEFDWASETARHVGTVVHRELQRRARAVALEVPEAAQLVALQSRFAAELAELGVPMERRQTAAMRVLEAVQRTLADARGRWLLGPQREAQSEYALTGVLGRDVVSVVIDRTFIDDAGTRWIVDYKTSSHEGAGLDEFLDRERERYAPQLERYAALLRLLGDTEIRVGLYFPLLAAWRAWTPATAALDSDALESAADAERAPA